MTTLGSEFQRAPTGNFIATYDGFGVSYRAYGEAPIQAFEVNSSDGETALYISGKYYILNGDWRLAYSELAQRGADACLEFFKSKYPQFGSSWSAEP